MQFNVLPSSRRHSIGTRVNLGCELLHLCDRYHHPSASNALKYTNSYHRAFIFPSSRPSSATSFRPTSSISASFQLKCHFAAPVNLKTCNLCWEYLEEV